MPFTVLHEAFEARADTSPDAIAISFEGQDTTYSELDRKANQIARYLRSRGARNETTVALILPRSVDAYASILGILKAGAAYVPIDPIYPRERVDYILENSDAKAVISTSEFSSLYSGFQGDVVRLDADVSSIESQSPGRTPKEETGVSPSGACYVIYTSGSTGHPKGVQIEHRSAVHLVQAEGEVYTAQPGDRVCQAASLSFDLSVEEVWLAFRSGATLYPVPDEASHGGPDFLRFLRDNRITILSCVPTLLSTINDDLPDLRLLILGGESCPDSLVAQWSKPGRRLINTYGPTETTVIATYAQLAPKKPVTIGKPLPGHAVRVLDESLTEVPRGEVGEICVGGVGVARGYVGLPEETRSKFIPDPFAPPERLYCSDCFDGIKTLRLRRMISA